VFSTGVDGLQIDLKESRVYALGIKRVFFLKLGLSNQFEIVLALIKVQFISHFLGLRASVPLHRHLLGFLVIEEQLRLGWFARQHPHFFNRASTCLVPSLISFTNLIRCKDLCFNLVSDFEVVRCCHQFIHSQGALLVISILTALAHWVQLPIQSFNR